MVTNEKMSESDEKGILGHASTLYKGNIIHSHDRPLFWENWRFVYLDRDFNILCAETKVSIKGEFVALPLNVEKANALKEDFLGVKIRPEEYKFIGADNAMNFEKWERDNMNKSEYCHEFFICFTQSSKVVRIKTELRVLKYLAYGGTENE